MLEWESSNIGDHFATHNSYRLTVTRAGDNAWDAEVTREGQVVWSSKWLAMTLHSSEAAKWACEAAVKVKMLEEVKQKSRQEAAEGVR